MVISKCSLPVRGIAFCNIYHELQHLSSVLLEVQLICISNSTTDFLYLGCIKNTVRQWNIPKDFSCLLLLLLYRVMCRAG